MSKYVNVPNGDYKIKVREGGSITLDTGVDAGEVRITGDLIVEGTATTVESENLQVKDNIIYLNTPESASSQGISLGTAGIEIDRGAFVNAQLLFNESLEDIYPAITTTDGAFIFQLAGSNGLKGIYTNSVNTGGIDLLLNTGNSSVVTVPNNTDYEEKVLYYSNGIVVRDPIAQTTIRKEDALVTAKTMSDFIDYSFDNVFLSQIGDGEIQPTLIQVRDNETTGVNSVITISVDSVDITKIYRDRWEFEDLRIIKNQIETLTSNEDLILSAPGGGSVRVNDTLHINSVPGIDDELNAFSLEPQTPLDGAKIYVNTESTGGTGIYFVNSDDRRDEIISRNRSLVFSMIF